MTKENELCKKKRFNHLKGVRDRSNSRQRANININCVSNSSLMTTPSNLIRINQKLKSSQTGSVNRENITKDSVIIDDTTNDILDDDTDTDFDEETKKYNQEKFTNKVKKNPVQVRHLFQINSVSTFAFCQLCKTDVKITGRSDANLRTHLANKHGMLNVLLPSQRDRKQGKIVNNEVKLPREEKILIDKELINCTIRDLRTFSDFHKPGMRQFLNMLKPGYKPCCKRKIRYSLKKK